MRSRAAEEHPTRATETILVVDDDAGVTRSVETVLRDEGFAVVTACGGADAIAIARRGEPRPRAARRVDAGPRRHRGPRALARATTGTSRSRHLRTRHRGSRGEGDSSRRGRFHRETVLDRRAPRGRAASARSRGRERRTARRDGRRSGESRTSRRTASAAAHSQGQRGQRRSRSSQWGTHRAHPTPAFGGRWDSLRSGWRRGPRGGHGRERGIHRLCDDALQRRHGRAHGRALDGDPPCLRRHRSPREGRR